VHLLTHRDRWPAGPLIDDAACVRRIKDQENIFCFSRGGCSAVRREVLNPTLARGFSLTNCLAACNESRTAAKPYSRICAS
jgi:hypothetical protein